MTNKLVGTIDVLKNEGIIPPDATLISGHNNIVLGSRLDNTIWKMAFVSEMTKREDPGDLDYAHRVSWGIRDANVGVVPLTANPIERHGVIISSYPRLETINGSELNAEDLSQKLATLNAIEVERFSKVGIDLHTLDIPAYAQRRLDYSRGTQLGDLVAAKLNEYNDKYPFSQLRGDDLGLVHGDLHSGNVVMDDGGLPLFIDFDSLAIGPVQYDLASWCIRSALGDPAPTNQMYEIARGRKNWRSESFAALMGWKVISSMTHILRYTEHASQRSGIAKLGHVAQLVGAATEWKDMA